MATSDKPPRVVLCIPKLKPRLVSVHFTTEYCSIGKTLVYQNIAKRIFRTAMLGRRRLIVLESVDAWIDWLLLSQERKETGDGSTNQPRLLLTVEETAKRGPLDEVALCELIRTERIRSFKVGRDDLDLVDQTSYREYLAGLSPDHQEVGQ